MKNIKWDISHLTESYKGGGLYRTVYALVYPTHGLTIERNMWNESEVYDDFKLLIIRHGKY